MAEVKAKVCLCGECGVGKTSLINRFVNNVYGDEYLKTIGTNVMKKEVRLQDPETHQDIACTYMVWDIMGEHQFRAHLANTYFQNANGVIMVMDLTREDTLVALETWKDLAIKASGKIPMVMLANKSDLSDDRAVSDDDIRTFAEKLGMPFHMTSAKTGENVEDAFRQLGLQMSLPA